jgi:uncharacterized protein (DUF1786 family)
VFTLQTFRFLKFFRWGLHECMQDKGNVPVSGNSNKTMELKQNALGIRVHTPDFSFSKVLPLGVTRVHARQR